MTARITSDCGAVPPQTSGRPTWLPRAAPPSEHVGVSPPQAGGMVVGLPDGLAAADPADADSALALDAPGGSAAARPPATVCVLGGPGSGKGTMCKKMAEGRPYRRRLSSAALSLRRLGI